VLALVLANMATAAAQEAGDGQSLAKAAQNPVGDLISLPFQNNMQFGVGPDDSVANILNIQPVCPIHLNDD
jgi:hypothetical protein